MVTVGRRIVRSSTMMGRRAESRGLGEEGAVRGKTYSGAWGGVRGVGGDSTTMMRSARRALRSVS